MKSDPNTLYVIVGDATTKANAMFEFCGDVCAWHDSMSDSGTIAGHSFDINARFAFIGEPTACPTTCGTSSSPNGDEFGDRMLNSTWHEIAEAVADANPHNMGYDEIGDLCSGTPLREPDAGDFPVGYAQVDVPYVAPNGEEANIHLGTNDYMLQPIWQHVQGGGCVHRLVENRPAMSATSGAFTGDFDGDLHGDLLYHDLETGQIAFQRLDSNAEPTGARIALGTASVGWMIEGIADFDRDGKSDILWRDGVDGALSIWINGVPHHIAETSMKDWSVRAVGDFDGNRAADILFFNIKTNDTRVWLNDGSLPAITQGWITSLPVTSAVFAGTSNVEVIGTGDFNQDQKADVLWRLRDIDAGTSQTFIWKMNGTTITPVWESFLDNKILLGVGTLGLGVSGAVGVDGSGNVFWADLATQTKLTIHSQPSAEWRYAGMTVVSGLGPCMFWYNRTTGEVKRWKLDWFGNYVASKIITQPEPMTSQLVAY